MFVLAGVPSIMRAMLDDIAPRLARGRPVFSITVAAQVAEGAIAGALAAIQARYSDVAIGSYPVYRSDGYGVQLVARGFEPAQVEEVASELTAMQSFLHAFVMAKRRKRCIVGLAKMRATGPEALGN